MINRAGEMAVQPNPLEVRLHVKHSTCPVVPFEADMQVCPSSASDHSCIIACPAGKLAQAMQAAVLNAECQAQV